jgi:hypothetical protein
MTDYVIKAANYLKNLIRIIIKIISIFIH